MKYKIDFWILFFMVTLIVILFIFVGALGLIVQEKVVKIKSLKLEIENQQNYIQAVEEFKLSFQNSSYITYSRCSHEGYCNYEIRRLKKENLTQENIRYIYCTGTNGWRFCEVTK